MPLGGHAAQCQASLSGSSSSARVEAASGANEHKGLEHCSVSAGWQDDALSARTANVVPMGRALEMFPIMEYV